MPEIVMPDASVPRCPIHLEQPLGPSVEVDARDVHWECPIPDCQYSQARSVNPPPRLPVA